jgi:uncharacterized protein (TIGR02145 family)
MNKNQNIPIFLILIMGVFIIFTNSCYKENHVNQIPICTITSPYNGEKIQQEYWNTKIISVHADDSDGNVIEVHLFINDKEVKLIENTTYFYNWNILEEVPRKYTIKAIVKDNEGGISTDEIEIEIIGIAPKAAFSSDKTESTVGAQIQFSDKSTNNPTGWKWNFGDGSTSTEQNPTHSYASMGSYTVSLTVTNSCGYETETKSNFIKVIGTFTDSRDGKTYKTVKIGNQVWMAENLNYKTSSGSWVYENIQDNASIYGRLYDWETADNVCPSGWHLPSDDEWKQLEMAIGMSQSEVDVMDARGTDEGYKLKAIGTWQWPDGTDEYGFAALPGGQCANYNNFYDIEYFAYFWTSTENGIGHAKY